MNIDLSLTAITLLVLCGVFISTVVMAIGIGGGILWTPVLILGYGLSPGEAVTLSLMIQVIGMASGTVAYVREKQVMPALAAKIFLAALPGVLIGSLFSISIAENILQMGLGIMSMTLAIFFVASQYNQQPLIQTGKPANKLAVILLVPGFFGFLMGALSTGIGEWLIPLLKSRLKIDMRRAIGTLVPVTFALVVVAASVRGFMDADIHWLYVLFGGIGTFIGAQIGPLVNKRFSDQILKEAFIYLMTLVGIHLIFQAL